MEIKHRSYRKQFKACRKASNTYVLPGRIDESERYGCKEYNTECRNTVCYGDRIKIGAIQAEAGV